MPRYWVSRIDKKNIDFFRDELDQCRLRQGWGWEETQNLRKMTFDGGASRNKRMFEEVKRDDIVLVPHLPDSGQVTIAKVEEDWICGYKFDLPRVGHSDGSIGTIPDKEIGDYGHCFPARKICTFHPKANVVSACIRSTLKCQLRFWNIDRLGRDILNILQATDEQRSIDISHDERLANAIDKSFNSIREELKENIYKEIILKFQAAEWEYVLEEVLRWRYPGASVERVGGPAENEHGTDLKVTISGFVDDQVYVVAVQVKDYSGEVDFNSLKDQISMMDHWQNQEGERVIDKVVIFTKATKKEQRKLPSCEDVTFVFADDFKELILQYALGHVR